MYGDFSRGHEPDRSRGRDYRRVLLQMGRPVLDSDVAAGVDALLGQVRATTRALGCAAGSPDLGFLITPGRLVTIFSEVAPRVRATQGSPQVWIDYRFRYAGRFPAVRIAATGPARVLFPVLQPLPAGSDLVLWVWAPVETSLSLNGALVAVPSTAGGAPVPVRFSVPGPLDTVEVTLTSGEVWLYLLEEHQPVGSLGAFALAAGGYQVDGLVLDAPGGGHFPELSFPPEAGFGWDAAPPILPDLAGLIVPPVPGTAVIAYLEVWERHVSAVEDPGLREVALGAGDTCTRTQLLGQVKLAPLRPGVIVGGRLIDQVRAAFAAVQVSGGELALEVPAGSPSTDPCALPEVSGYSGGDNRLYRIEVHRGGPLASVALKWSRDNGSELFAAELSPEHTLLLPAGTPLAAGDIVEVLSSVVDLGDDVLARVEAGGFVPAERAVGQLGQLLAVPSVGDEDSVQFALAALDDVTDVLAIDVRAAVLPEARLKVRRWHGVLDPQQLAGAGTALPGPHVLEDGITLTLSGTGEFRPGQYWQYQARSGGTQAESPWQAAPHGPQRQFAPLALLQLPDTATSADPWQLVAWFDQRFSPPCDLDADGVAFYGGRIDSSADTVQEALEELYGRIPVPQLWPTITGIGWTNDRALPFSQFQTGLQVSFSEEMDSFSASAASFVVTLEVPTAGKPQLRQPLILDGKVNVSGLSWTFVPDAVDASDVAGWSKLLGGGVRCRVRLAADVILARAGGRPLDGEAVGLLHGEGYETFIDLRLPSGDGQRGGDFHSWFYLEAPPPAVRVESIDPGDGAQITPQLQLGAILISFTEAVRFATLNESTVIVSVTPPGQRVSQPVPGTISPYPFEPDARLVSRVTFAPTQADIFRPTEGLFLQGPSVFTVQLRGSADQPIQDSEGRALDGEGSGRPSDFVSQFTLLPGAQ